MSDIAAYGRVAKAAGINVARAALIAAGAAGIWTLIASSVFLWSTGLLNSPDIAPWARPYQWFRYAPYATRSFAEASGLLYGALIATAPFAALVRWQWRRVGGLMGITRKATGFDRIVRGSTDNHGRSDWMGIEQARKLFPGANPDLGGIVVGEAERVDQGPVAKVRFLPDDRSTWGNGGKSPLLIDPCKYGSTHSLIIAGSGGYKTTSLTTSLLTWKKSRVVMDPSTELGPMLCEALEDTGQRVVQLGVGANGFNAISWIDINDPLAETKVRAVIGRITGPVAANAREEDQKFKAWGKSIATALLAYILWSDAPPEMKTPRNLRAGLVVGQEEMREVLRGIAATSESNLARDLARSMMDIVDDTFSGAYANIVEDTAWLSTEAYADLVSGDEFDLADLVGGKLSVFLQIPLDALQETPAVARVVIGGLLNSVFEADGRVDGRVAFFIDEAVLLGPMNALQTARDQGRKYRITLQLFYQSEGKIEEVWGKAGKDAWFDGVSWRSYAGIQNLNTAKDLSMSLGTFGAMATSQGDNRGRQGRMFEMPSSSSGSNQSRHEISRELEKPHELLQNWRADERLTLVRNEKPIRHGTAIGFRRPEIEAKLADSRFV